MAFIGVLFSIILSNRNEYTKIFLMILSIILFLSFLLLIDDLWVRFKWHEKNIKEQEEKLILHGIRQAATVKLKNAIEEDDIKKFSNCGSDAEDRISRKERISELIQRGENTDNIVKQMKAKRSWKLDFILWVVLFLSVPILFLLEILNFFE